MNRKAPKSVAQSTDPLTVAVSQQAPNAPHQAQNLEGLQTIQFDPSNTLIIAIKIDHDILVGQTELLTQSFGHGAKKDILASVTYNKIENGQPVMDKARVQGTSGINIRHLLAGHCTKIVSESKVLNV